MLKSLISRKKILSWIKSEPEGLAILVGYEKTHIFRTRETNIIVGIIVKEMLKVSTFWENSHFNSIAQILAGEGAIFPDQAVETYYIPPVKTHVKNNVKIKGRASAGKIPTKYRNSKQKIKELEKSTISQDNIEENLDPETGIPSQEVKDSINWLQNNEGPTEDPLKHWKVTAKHRFKCFQANKYRSVESIFQEWSVLQNPDLAAHLIKIDFDINFTAEKDAITNFTSFFQTIKSQQSTRKDIYIQNLEDIAQSDIFPADTYKN